MRSENKNDVSVKRPRNGFEALLQWRGCHETDPDIKSGDTEEKALAIFCRKMQKIQDHAVAEGKKHGRSLWEVRWIR
jgi:hypothetical protein